MTSSSASGSAAPSRELSRKVAIVGLGETDYAADYKAARSKEPTYVPPDPQALGARAFERALADSGLEREQIDGLSVSFTYGGPDPETMAEVLGIRPRYATRAQGLMAGVIPLAVEAMVSGECDTMALVYSVASRAIGRRYGGETYQGVGPSSYFYHAPWGWSSQAAHWAFMFQYYQATYGATEADLGSVAVLLRENAMLNENAVMRMPLTIQDYLESRYIVRPLHLFDMCLVNDGGVCLILRKADALSDLPRTPVFVAGWGDSEVHDSKMQYMVKERLRPQMQEAGAPALAMAGMDLSDIHHFQGYDASSIHLINQVEGYGFVKPGEGLDFCREGHAAIGGKLPINTSGGMLSESYMHGWNHVVEATRQLRHEAGARQVEGVQTSMFSLATTESAHPLILARGA